MRGIRIMRMRSRVAFASLALGVAALGGFTATATAAGTSYVALGDSYTAGATAPLIEGAGGCRQFADSYPYLVAQADGLSLADASCGGATVQDMTTSQKSGVAPQFDALQSSTGVVTIGIGGNDNGLFISTIVTCGALDAADVFDVGAPCQRVEGATFDNEIDSDAANIGTALAQIHELSPDAKVFVVGYPDLLPLTGSCRTVIPLTSGDISYLNGVQAHLNSMLAAEAAANDASFIDTFTPSIGHDMCKPIGTRWIEPVVPDLLASDFVPLHPNALGELADAGAVESAFAAAGIG